MNDSAPEQTTPTTVPDVLDAAIALVADGAGVAAAINNVTYGSPEIRPGTPLAAEARATLIRGIDPGLLPEWPDTYPESVLAHWADQVSPDDVVATMRRVAEEVRTAERPPQ